MLSIVVAQDMDTSGYQVSDLEDMEFHWENDQLDVDTVSRPGKKTPFSPSTFNGFEIGSIAKNPFLIEEKQDKENSSPPHPVTPVSDRPTQTPVLMTSRLFKRRNESVPDYANRNIFEQFLILLLCIYFKINYEPNVNINYEPHVSFYNNFSQKLVNYARDKSSSSIVIIGFTIGSNFLHK